MSWNGFWDNLETNKELISRYDESNIMTREERYVKC